MALAALGLLLLAAGGIGTLAYGRYHREQVRREIVAAITGGDARRIAELMGEGGDPNLRGENGTTALMAAAMQQNPAWAVRFLRAGVDPNAATTFGRATALMQAASHGDAAMAKLLLAAGARPDARDEQGRTALMFAATSGNAAAVQALLAGGADPGARDGSGKTALSLSREQSWRKPAQAVLEQAAFEREPPPDPTEPGARRDRRFWITGPREGFPGSFVRHEVEAGGHRAGGR